VKHLLLSLLLFYCLTATAFSQEKILQFHSDIEVLGDGSMQVCETISVHAQRDRIRRGIYRDFPTRYRDRFGNRYQVEFTVVDVTRDGRPELWHSEKIGSGMRIYLGDRNVLLAPGDYTYTLTYRTNRQLGFFDSHDELYWNVTGNGWDFSIDSISARVRLPVLIDSSEMTAEAYTGHRGERGQDYHYHFDEYGGVIFETTRTFLQGEGLTLVVAWPKGYVLAPTRSEEIDFFLYDNRTWLIGLIGCGLLLVYQLIAWFVVGRGPRSGGNRPRYQPPSGITPSAARYLMHMRYDHKTFAAALVNLAVQGVIEIREEAKDSFTLIRSDLEAQNCEIGENGFLQKLLGRWPGASLSLNADNQVKIAAALKAHKTALATNTDKFYFVTNRPWVVAGIVWSLLVLIAMLFSLGDFKAMGLGVFLILWLAMWTYIFISVGKSTLGAWQRDRSLQQIIVAIVTTLLFVLLGFIEVLCIVLLHIEASSAFAVLIPVMIGLHFLFNRRIKAPTRLGRRLLDELNGFRSYLEVATEEGINFHNPPKKTPELFERFFPYALAFDIERHWVARFASTFQGLKSHEKVAYHPVWLRSDYSNRDNYVPIVSSFGNSLSSAVSSSSAPVPGSSFRSGGGGSSGDGGGGGGGGW